MVVEIDPKISDKEKMTEKTGKSEKETGETEISDEMTYTGEMIDSEEAGKINGVARKSLTKPIGQRL